MNVEDEEWVQHALVDYERKRCISKVLSIECKKAIPKGNNFSSDMYRLHLKTVQHSGDVVDKSLIYKAMPLTESRKAFVKEVNAYGKETRMYNEVLQEMERIRQEKEFGAEPLFPVCYGIKRGHAAYLLEDLTALGYKMADRLKGLDIHHAYLVMKALAKFHALSLVLIERGDIIQSDFSEDLYSGPENRLEPIIKTGILEVANTIERQCQGEWLTYVEKLRGYEKTVMPKFLEELKPNKKNINVLVHGDCWTNNMMFRYNNEGEPQNIRFLDFQFSHYNTIGVDLQYFFHTSLNSETLSKKQELLEVYYNTFKCSLCLYGYKGEVPTFEHVQESYDHTRIYGFTLGLAYRPLMMQSEELAPDDLEEWIKTTLSDGRPGVTVDLECVREVLYYGRESGIL